MQTDDEIKSKGYFRRGSDDKGSVVYFSRALFATKEMFSQQAVDQAWFSIYVDSAAL